MKNCSYSRKRSVSNENLQLDIQQEDNLVKKQRNENNRIQPMISFSESIESLEGQHPGR